MVYTPLQIRSVNADEWVSDFYLDVYKNDIANEKDIYFAKFQKETEQKKPKIQENQAKIATLAKEKDTFTLMYSLANTTYQY